MPVRNHHGQGRADKMSTLRRLDSVPFVPGFRNLRKRIHYADSGGREILRIPGRYDEAVFKRGGGD